MFWDVPKGEKLDLNVFFKLCKGGISVNPNLYWKIGENDFLSIARK